MPTFTTEITATVDIDFEVFCNECGTGLCNQSDTDSDPNKVYVYPCKKCMENNYDSGYERGLQEETP